MMIHAGHQNMEIMVAAQCYLNTVKAIRHYLENFDANYVAVARRKQHNRRSDCVHTAEFLKNPQKYVLEDAGIGTRDLSGGLNVSGTATNLALSEDLRYYSYKHRRVQLLAKNTCANRLKKVKKLLSKVKHPAKPQAIWFFLDEKYFCQDQRHNMQNNGWLAYCPKNAHRVMQTKFSQAVMDFWMCVLWGWCGASTFFCISQVELRCLCGVANHCS